MAAWAALLFVALVPTSPRLPAPLGLSWAHPARNMHENEPRMQAPELNSDVNFDYNPLLDVNYSSFHTPHLHAPHRTALLTPHTPRTTIMHAGAHKPGLFDRRPNNQGRAYHARWTGRRKARLRLLLRGAKAFTNRHGNHRAIMEYLQV